MLINVTSPDKKPTPTRLMAIPRLQVGLQIVLTNKTNPEARKHFDDIIKRQMDLQLVQRTSMLSKCELASGCDVALAQRLRRTKRRLLLAAVGQDASESTCSVSSRSNLNQRLSFESFTSHDSMSGSAAL